MDLILPGDPLYYATLYEAKPPDWEDAANRDGDICHFVFRQETGLMEAVTYAELEEYLNSGEYDDRLEEIGLDVES